MLQKKRGWRRMGAVVLLLSLCLGARPVQAEPIEAEEGTVTIRPGPENELQWKALRACIIDCTISSHGKASIYSNAMVKQTSQKVKVTATLTEFDSDNCRWIDHTSISATGYGCALVQTDYWLPSREGLYYNRTNIKTYYADGSLAETEELYTEPQYYGG